VWTLLGFVTLQSVLYGINLKLLPIWGDEVFTVLTVAESPRRICAIVRQDIHPPLYFLLAHWWNRIPIGSDPLVRLRALSALFAVLTTIFIDRCWLRSAPQGLRHWFLLFWTFSPCLLLYSRMARSYSLQVLLASVSIWCLLRFAGNPDGGNLVAFAIALAALLYTHYVPGIAIWAGANLLLMVSLRGARDRWKPLVLANALVAALYAPWLVILYGALGKWRHNQVYSMTSNLWTEQLLKLGCWFYSFAFGESIPLWLLLATLVFALPCLWLIVSGARLRRNWLWPALFTAAVAYLGVSRWIAAPSMGSHLLFLLPLYIVALAAGVASKHRAGTAIGVILFTMNLAGVWTYYEVRNLLNSALLVPSQRIAAEIVQHSKSEDTVVWIDDLRYLAPPLEYYLPKSFRVRPLTSAESVEAARSELDAGTIRHIWFVRGTHDVSSGHVFEKLQSQMMETRNGHTLYPYVPFSSAQLAILRVLRTQDGNQLQKYYCEVWEFRDPANR
jgi:hypothetical protein